MDYQPQTMSTKDMNEHLDTMLAEIRAIQNAVELSIDEVDAAFAAAAEKMAAMTEKLDEEYAALEDINADTESAVDALILNAAKLQSEDE